MVRLVEQRARRDCGVAALATIVSAVVDSEAVYTAAAAACPKAGLCGTRARDLVAIAGTLGVVLTPKRTYDLDRDRGVLRLYGSHTARRGHWVAVIDGGLIADPAAGGWLFPWAEYVRRYRARCGTLLAR